MAPNDLVVLGIVGGLALFFLVSGIRGLRRGRVTVVNPHHESAWPGVLGMALYVARRATGLHDDGLAHGPTMTLEGREARGRAWFYVVAGLLCSLVALAHLVNTGSW